MIRILFSDLDGTLWDEIPGTFTVRVDDLTAIHKLLDAGIEFAIATGRGEEQARKLQQAAGLEKLDMVCKNGSSAIYNKEEIAHWTIPGKQIIEAIERAMTRLNLVILLTTSIGGMAIELNEVSAHQKALWPKAKRVSFESLKANCDFEVYKATVMTETDEERSIAYEVIAESGLPIRCITNQLKNVEWVHSDCSKGRAIAYYCQNRNIAMEEVAFIGDETNDIEAMQMAGLSFCMSTARLEVQKEADFVVNSVQEAIEHVLKK